MFLLQPACKSYLWGGTTLKNEYYKRTDETVLAETWELSCHPDGESLIASGPCKGQTLRTWLEKNAGAGTACDAFDQFPILIKLIDAAQPLSVQVHPDNAYALEHEGQYGKTEVWYVVSAQPGAFLYYGFEKELTQQQFCEAIENNTLCETLHRAPVQAGDVFFIEAGTIHAIGAGIVIAEIQQSSNVTYRVYDYGRVGANGKTRPLHVAQAQQVTALTIAKKHNFGTHLAQCRYFTVDKLTVHAPQQHHADATSFHALLCLEGQGTVAQQGEVLPLQKGQTVFVAADSGAYTLDGNATLLVSYVEPAIV